VRVSIEDDGRGIQPGAAEKSTGYGLTSMRQRVESIGGQLRLESHGWGTRVVVEVPIPSDEGIGPSGLDGREARPSLGGVAAADRVQPRFGSPAASPAAAPASAASALGGDAA